MPDSNLHKLSALGQSVWIDFLSRQLLRSGKLARMMEEDAVVGVTSNPTIFQKAIAEGDAYNDQLKEILDGGEQDAKEVFLQLYRREPPIWHEPAAEGWLWRAASHAAQDWYEREGEQIMRMVDDLVTAAGGSISAEHGIGQLKLAELERLAPPGDLRALRAIKHALDPLGIMNPGKLVP